MAGTSGGMFTSSSAVSLVFNPYCQVMEDAGSLRVTDTLHSAPEPGTLPVPTHPVHTYCVPTPPDTGELVTHCSSAVL